MRVRGLAPFLLLSALVSSAYAQQAAGARTISGIVLSEKTGHPLARAEVTLHDTRTRKETASTTTDSEGLFTFSNLPDGRFDLSAARHGYVSRSYQQHPGGISTAIVTGEGKSSTDLRLSLEPEAAIYGAVLDDSGDPVPQARVLLFRRDHASGTEKIVRASQTAANPAGEYELHRLAPGSYFICAIGTPWFANRMRGAPQRADIPRSPLDVAYPVACHPGVTEPSEAESVDLTPGERVEIPITMHAVPAVHVTMQMPAPQEGRGFAVPQVKTDLFGTSEFAMGPISYINHGEGANRSITLEMAGIAPGQYHVDIPGQNGDTQRNITLNASGDAASIDPSAAVPEASVTGKVTIAGGTFRGNAVAVLRPKDGAEITAPVLPDNTFKFEAVPPGEYRVELNSFEGPLRIRTIEAKGAVVQGRSIAIAGDPITLSLAALAGSARISGTVLRGNADAPGVFVLLVPHERDRAPAPNQSDSDGSFEFEHVPPGEYTAVAIEDGWTLDWGQRSVLEPYLARGSRITVSPDAREVSIPNGLQVLAK